TDHWKTTDGADKAPSPKDLCVAASRGALADAGIDASEIDTLAVARLTVESGGQPRYVFGQNSNLPGTIARDIGAKPKHAIYAVAGGQSSQQLVNEMAGRIYRGESEIALITGSEANRSMKQAKRAGIELDWKDADELDFEDRGPGPMLLSRTEIKHGMVLPAYFYGVFENVLAHEWGETRSQHRASMAALFAKFAAVASQHPKAQFDTSTFDEDFLATPSKDNYPFADPFLKWLMAQDNVNQAAAVLLMSDAKADALGVPIAKRVYVHGMGEASDDHISVRPKLNGSWAMNIALNRALEQAGKSAAQIDVFDLYSCFPCAVFSSMNVLGIDHTQDPRPLTVTGGLPYFGGPGNNYSLHAIVSMADRMRAQRGQFGLVLANGGWMTKEAAAVWSTTKPEEFVEVDAMATPDEQVEIDPSPSAGVLESFTVAYGKDGPQKAIVFARTATGQRFIGNASATALPRFLEEVSPIGARIRSEQTDDVNSVDFVE
ncbi:MAG: acetyl-CoA acetyltransferase, partial [Pseudomonadota bacterium]